MECVLYSTEFYFSEKLGDFATVVEALKAGDAYLAKNKLHPNITGYHVVDACTGEVLHEVEKVLNFGA